jgi:hypothetical protein
MSATSETGLQASNTQIDSTESTTPGVDTADFIAAEFGRSEALFTISLERTLIVAQPKLALLGFRDIINRLLAIDAASNGQRILIWVLDMGMKDFEDPNSRLRFLNVQSLIARFKALRSFKERIAESRWNWLQSRTVVLLRDNSRGEYREGSDRIVRFPEFSAQHVLFDEVPLRWTGSSNFRALYGREFESLNEMIYSIFMSKSAPDASDKAPAIDIYKFRYCGHAPFSPGFEEDLQVRGLDLPSPGRQYEAALRTVYTAARHVLGLRGVDFEPAIDTQDAVHGLELLGFVLLRLDDFVRY